MSKLAKQAGLRRLRSRVKRSVMVRQALYRPYREDRPTIDPAVAAELRLGFADEVLRLDSLLGRPVAATWGYAGLAPGGGGRREDDGGPVREPTTGRGR